jgi:hypothetical protein
MKSKTSRHYYKFVNFHSAKNFLILALAFGLGFSSMCLPVARSQNDAGTAEADNAVPVNETKVDYQATAKKALDRMQDSFIENRGQIIGDAAYYLNDGDKTIYFNNQGLTFALNYFDAAHSRPQTTTGKNLKNLPPMPETPTVEAPDRWVVKMDFVGANPDVKLLAKEVNATTINNFKGQKERWQTGLKTYRKLVYLNVWAGIDLEYSNDESGLKYTFVVKPGGDPNQIKVAYKGASDIKLGADGQLEIHTPAGPLNDGKPYSFQERDGKQLDVTTTYTIVKDESSASCAYGFQVADYDKSQPLYIDPIFIFSGFLGGSSGETGYAIGLDSVGNIYVAGDVFSAQPSFPASGGFDTSYNGSGDAFIAKINADGSGVAYCGYIGGTNTDHAYAIAVDAAGNAYVSGYTLTTNGTFPTLIGPDTTYNGGFWDDYIAKIDTSGALAYCGYIGGNGEETGYGIAVDSSGNAYVTGYTNSTFGFPQLVGPDLTFNFGSDCWIAKVNSSGSLVYCGYIGGSSNESAGWYDSLAVDSSGNAYVVGFTLSNEATFPETVGPDLTYNGGSSLGDGFIAKVNAAGTGLVYCGYIGGSLDDQPNAVAVDSSGNAYVVGGTSSLQTSPTPFPVTVGPDLTHNGGGEGFIAKVNAAGNGLAYCGYIGGSGNDSANGVAVDAVGNAYVTGTTSSNESSFPVTVGPDTSFNGGTNDAYIAKINSAGNGYAYCGYIGGSGDETGYGIAVDASGYAYVTGTTSSTETSFPISGGPDLSQNGGSDVFITKISPIPSAATLASFTATGFADGYVLLRWKTAYEANNLGFNIYRDDNNGREKINPSLVAGSALTFGTATTLNSGNTYLWGDAKPSTANPEYWLEAIDLNNQSHWFGPIGIQRSTKQNNRGDHQQAVLLSQLSQRDSQTEATLSEQPDDQAVMQSSFHHIQVSPQAGFAGSKAIKIAISQEGWYRITAEELLQAGLESKVDPRNLQLFAEGNEVAILVNGEADGKFNPADTVEFYAQPLTAAYDNTRVYWLVAGAQAGQRIGKVKGKATSSKYGNFPCLVERRDRTVYFPALRNGEAENFFGGVITSRPLAQNLKLTGVAQSSEPTSLEVVVQGVTHSLHYVKANLNGMDLGAVAFHGQTKAIAKFDISQSNLIEGDNAITLTALGGEQDVCVVDTVRVSYLRNYVASNDSLKCTTASKQKITIDGFSNQNIRLIDVTSPNAPQEVKGLIQPQGDRYSITTTAPKGGRSTLLAFTEQQIKKPNSITFNEPSNWRGSSLKSDLLIITRKAFAAAVEPLKGLRESQGLKVDLVDIEDIYDEFNFGERSPQAVKDFLALAKTSGQNAPRYVLVVGDATYDPKNYSGLGNEDFLPTKLIDTDYIETASDDWLVDFNNDGFPEMSIGRLPARTSQEAWAMVTKVISYENATRPDGVLLVSDANDSFNFESANEELKGLISVSRVEEIRRGRLDPTSARSNLLSAIGRGPRVITYAGHGTVDGWRGNLLSSDDVRSLNNQALPTFTLMTCLNGYFQDPQLDALAESLIKLEHGGAVAVWASSGMTDPGGQVILNQAFFRQVFSGEAKTLGEATLRAKAAVGDLDIRRTWILFGDPSMRMN